MKEYTLERKVGEGTYGSVWLATCHATKEKVAIKQLKDGLECSENVGEKVIFRDLHLMGKLSHPNLVRMRALVQEGSQIYFVFDFMPQNLLELIHSRKELFTDLEVRKITQQILQGVLFLHRHGFFHRDLKPENILCDGIASVKIGDLGQARRIRSLPPYTDCIATRWYRAPEVLVNTTNYSSPVDIWAVGCIMGELYTLKPLFQGKCEIDQLYCISEILGTPTARQWLEGCMLVGPSRFSWIRRKGKDFRKVFPTACRDALEILTTMLSWNPRNRPTAWFCLRHAAFCNVEQLYTKSLSSAARAKGAVTRAEVQPQAPCLSPPAEGDVQDPSHLPKLPPLAPEADGAKVEREEELGEEDFPSTSSSWSDTRSPVFSSAKVHKSSLNLEETKVVEEDITSLLHDLSRARGGESRASSSTRAPHYRAWKRRQEEARALFLFLPHSSGRTSQRHETTWGPDIFQELASLRLPDASPPPGKTRTALAPPPKGGKAGEGAPRGPAGIKTAKGRESSSRGGKRPSSTTRLPWIPAGRRSLTSSFSGGSTSHAGGKAC